MSVVFTLFLVVFFVWQFLSITHTYYELRPDGFMIKTGVIGKSQSLLLYSQIQNVTEFQTFWGRIIGLKSLQIETMTRASAIAGKLANLRDSDATELRTALLAIVNDHSQQRASQLQNESLIENDLYAQKDESKSNPYALHFTRYISLAVVTLAVLIVIAIFLTVKAALTPDLPSALTSRTGNILVMLTGYLIYPIILLLFLPVHYVIQQMTFRYWLGSRTVSIKSGLISTQQTDTEYSKIQDFILRRGIIDRAFGLAEIKIETGAADYVPSGRNDKQRPNYKIQAMLATDAQSLAKFLIGKMGIHYTPSEKPLVLQAPLSPKKPIKKTVETSFWLLILALVAIAILKIVSAVNKNSFPVSSVATWVFGVWFAITILVFIYENLYLKYYYYDWSRDTLTIRKGVYGSRQIYLEIEKIQNVFVDMDIFDRLFGLYDLHVSTVGKSSFQMCHIDGLDKATADRMLRAFKTLIKQNIKK